MVQEKQVFFLLRDDPDRVHTQTKQSLYEGKVSKVARFLLGPGNEATSFSKG